MEKLSERGWAALLSSPAMRNVEENFGLRFYGRVAANQFSKSNCRRWGGFVGHRRRRPARKHRALLGDGLPGRSSIFLLLLQHLHHGAMVFAIPPATGRKIRLRTGQQSGQSEIAGENEQ